MPTVLGLGELLWDLLPSGPQLGGAPANFSIMAARLGATGVLLSRTGADELGEKARTSLASVPIDSSYLQRDPTLPTGTVSVTLSDGQPSYTIHQPVAWDALELTPQWLELAARADCVCFGTLAQRSPQARETVQQFLAHTRPDCLRIFDINLRSRTQAVASHSGPSEGAAFFGSDAIRSSLMHATLLKLNEGEVAEILSFAGPGGDALRAALAQELAQTSNPTQLLPALQQAGQLLLATHPNLQLVAITLGAHGSLLITRTDAHRHPGVPTKLADAIGAGDAFTAALAVYFLQQAPLARLNEAANRWGSFVASHRGATPPFSQEIRSRIEREIASA